MRFVTLALVALLAVVQYSLWLGDGGLRHVAAKQRELDGKLRANAERQRTNERLLAEVDDLRQGLEMVEERARSELGMVKPDEVFVQYLAKR
ncbi:cell division protein FtsB [Ideonella sp. DXS22W]|uniref:Cell division protein FtsB n=1 Tax=Pseudaquabacterium inlustre TaxID=2984192 RepID=A0ABU9CAJ8_9BURK